MTRNESSDSRSLASKHPAQEQGPSIDPSSDTFSDLEPFGWDDAWRDAFASFVGEQSAGDSAEGHSAEGNSADRNLVPARVISASREIYRLRLPAGELTAKPSGSLRSAGTLPAVGDWVVCDRPAAGRDPDSGTDLDGTTIVRAILPRRTRLSRKEAGERTAEQVVAANVDVVFLVMGLDGDFNLRRLERFALMAWESGAEPVVILTKADRADDPMEMRWRAEDAVPGVRVHVTSSVTGEGLEPVRAELRTPEGDPPRTISMIGSSGVGKSTLTNRLCGAEVMATGAVREGDDRGRHTTTMRQLLRLPGGGLLIDNPGVREIQLWADGESSLGEAFDDLESLAQSCRFGDCAHVDEPGCEVLAAVGDGRLDPSRLESYRGLQAELRHLELKRDVAARRQENRKIARLHRSIQRESRRRKRF